MTRSVKKGPFIDPCLIPALAFTRFNDLLINFKNTKINKSLINEGTSKRINSTLTSSTNTTLENFAEKPLLIWSRRSCIHPATVGLTVKIYTGKVFLLLKIRDDMVGHKFGEFASTRKKVFHKKKVRVLVKKKK